MPPQKIARRCFFPHQETLVKITDSDRAMPNKKVKPQNGFPFLLGTYQKITAVAITLCLKII